MSMERGQGNIRLFPLFLLSSLLFLAVVLPMQEYLVIRDTRSNQEIWKIELKETKNFSIQWTHSIHRTPVEEYYQIKHRQLYLARMAFEDYGIGMNSELAPGEQLSVQGGKFVVENIERIYPALHLFVGQVRANHAIHIGNVTIPLQQLTDPGTSITIQVEEQSILHQIGGNLIREYSLE